MAKYLNPAVARQAGVARQINTRAYYDMVYLSATFRTFASRQRIYSTLD